MKKSITVLAAVLITASVQAQAPQKMSYQAVIRDSASQLVSNKPVGMQISILQGSPGGLPVYSETQTPITDANGLVSMEIGGATGFDTINWANGTYFLKTETDPTGGTNYTISGATQLLSVPYALYAEKSGSASLPQGTSGQTLRHNGAKWEANSILFNDGTNIGVNTSNPQAALDVTSTAGGFLMPRMTTAERNAVVSPAHGLQIVNTTTNCVEICFGTTWQKIFCGCDVPPAAPAEGTHNPGQTNIVWNWNTVSGIYAKGYKWNSVNDYNSATDKGTSTSHSQAAVCNTPYTSFVWAYNDCGNSPATLLTDTTTGYVGNPTLDTITSTLAQIVWKWNAVINIYGYKWNTVNDYNTAKDNYNNTALTQDFLKCNTSYTIYVWAYNSCMHSAIPLIMTKSTGACKCGGITSITDARDNKVYNIIDIGSQCWMKENMDIGTQINLASPYQTNNSIIEKFCYNDSVAKCADYGGLYQWAEAVQYLNGASNTGGWSPVPTGNVQGICPTGWHIPTKTEFNTFEYYINANSGNQMSVVAERIKETGTVHWLSPNTASNSSGFTALPAGRTGTDPFVYSGIRGSTHYWTTTSSGTTAGHTDLNINFMLNFGSEKSQGFSVRCLKD